MAPGSAAKILIVDDQHENLLALAAVLEPLGHHVVEAGSGEEALKRLLEEEFHLIVLDVQMPGLDGFQTAEIIKQRERTRHVPIIFLTAIDKEAHHVFRGYSVGAVDYVVKPFDPEVLRSKVSVFVELHRTSLALRESEERFRTAFAAAPIGIGLLGVDGRFAQVNQALCKIVGRSQADLIDAPLSRLFPELDGEPGANLLQRVQAAKVHGLHEERSLLHGDGRGVEVLLSMSATDGEEGRPPSFIVQVVDLTERAARRQAEAAAETLQRTLLPDRLPQIPGIEVAARYLPGGQVGGDWYDAIPLDGDRLGLAMGDVVGQGLAAASVMGTLRNSLRAYALEGHGPAAVLERLDRLVDLERDGMATLVYIEIEPDLTSLRIASAGHLPPLVVAPDGSTSYVSRRGSVPLGVGRGRYEESMVSVEPGSTLVLFTDGLVEERGESIEVGLERMRRSLAGLHDDPDSLCDRLLEAMGREHGTDDDVTVLAVGTVAVAPEPLHLTLPADPSALAGMRRRVGRWLEELGASEDERYEIQVACNEACGNSMEHGFGFGEGTLKLEATPGEDGVTILVRDGGGWRTPRAGERGRGLVLMRGLMSSVEVEASADGTAVELRRRIAALAERRTAGLTPS